MLLPYSDAQGRPREVQRVKHSFYYGRPELVAWCSVLLYLGFCLSKQRYTLCTPNATDPVVSLGSAHNEVDDLDSHAALTLHRWVIPKAWPQFLTRLSCVNRMTLSETILQNLIHREFRYLSPWLARLIKTFQTNFDSKASHHDHDSTVAHFTEVDWVRCCLSLPTRLVGTAVRSSFINYCGPIDCLSPCNL